MRLFQEKAQLEVELLKAQEESRLDEAKFATLGQPSAYAASALEQQIGIAEKEATALSLEVVALSSKVAALEQALTTYRPNVENFKSLQQKQP